MPKDDLNYKFTENGLVYDFYDVFVPAENFRQPSLWVWGANSNGQLGDFSTTQRNIPVTTFAGGTNWKQISCGLNQTLAIKTDGSLWVWGRNQYGQLGINQGNVNRNTPVTTFAGGNDWKQVSSGREHTAAIKTDGSLWVWGLNNFKQLGINQGNVSRNTPVTTFAGGNDWKSVSCGFFHTAAIKTDGSLWVWGRNDVGHLGTNDNGDKIIPVTTFAGGNNWKSVSCAFINTAAIKTDGSLWVWGGNAYTQLGINQGNVNRNTPVTTFAGGNNWKQVSVGSIHVSAIKTDGSLWIWGNNYTGRLGINSPDTNRSTPVTTFAGGTNWKSVSCLEHSAAIKTDGTLWTWGQNNQGQLGINNTNQKNTPVTTFAGGNNWKQVSAGSVHTGAIKYNPDP